MSSLKKRLGKIVRTIAPGYAETVLMHYYKHGTLRLFLMPRTANELIQHKKLFSRDPRLTLTADKFAVRAFVRDRIGEQYLIPLLAVADDPATIDFDALPAAFVAKATHGSGFNLFVEDKAKFDRCAAIATLGDWLRQDYSSVYREWAYRDIPRRITVEPMLNAGGSVPTDYKLWAFGGRVRLINTNVYDAERTVRAQDLFDEHWRPLAVEYHFPNSAEPPPRPTCFTAMLGLAERLASEFDFVRVDFYVVDGQIYFGEITHYPNGGLCPFHPVDFDLCLGAIWRRGGAIPERFYESAAATARGVAGTTRA